MLDESKSIMPLSSGASKRFRPSLILPHCLSIIGVVLAATCIFTAMPLVAAANELGDLAARGKYLATAADCAACHTAPHGGQPFAGGYGIVSPLGTIFSTNITPSTQDGIGAYGEEDFSRAVRQGVAKDGSHLYPAMPYTSYAKISDEDMKALYAYFMHDVKPIDQTPQKTALPFPFSIRASMGIWSMLFLAGEGFRPDASKSPEWNRGAYLAGALAHCSTCHTPRNELMAEIGSKSLSGGAVGAWYAPNITSDKTSGIGGWSDDELNQYLSTGHIAGKAQAAGPMAEAIENSLQYLSKNDIRSLVVYLKDTRPITSEETAPRYDLGKPSLAEANLRGLPGQAFDENGFHVFSGTCAACHQADGSGNSLYPSLFHNTATGADRPDNLIATILFGVSRTVGKVPAFMPGFGPDASFTDRLSDRDIADVANYVLSHFGNAAVKVTPADVDRIRDGGEKPLLAQLSNFSFPLMIAAALIVLMALVYLLLVRRSRPVSA